MSKQTQNYQKEQKVLPDVTADSTKMGGMRDEPNLDQRDRKPADKSFGSDRNEDTKFGRDIGAKKASGVAADEDLDETTDCGSGCSTGKSKH